MIDFTFLGLVRRSKRQFVSCSVDDSYLQKWDNSFPWGFETQAPFDTCWMCLDAVGRDLFFFWGGGCDEPEKSWFKQWKEDSSYCK